MTLDELTQSGASARERVEHLRKFLDIDTKSQELKNIEEKMAAPDFWNNKEEAQSTVAALSACRNQLEPFNRVATAAEDFHSLVELAAEDPSLLPDVESEWMTLEKNLADLELLSFLAGKFDRKGTYLTIHAGAGGTESCDWASMLLRMYRRFAERKNWKESIIDIQPGDEAGIKSVTMLFEGDFAYGYLSCERGIHRLVRISPFDSNARRHTSFVSVDAIPVVDEDIDIEIADSDLRIDTYRSSGAGGQHVNTTDSAVRITHLPTGTVVCCQNERSQHKNRATAMQMLKAKLYQIEEEKRKAEADQQREEKTEMGWGNQIRSYVLQPYQMVKDLRTNEETGNTTAVLDGEIDRFIEAYLKSGRA